METEMNLADRFIELLHINWHEFVKLEADDNATNDEAMLTGLIRACADGDMRSIKTAFARSDGEVEIPVQIKAPKVYVRYINAKEKEKAPKEIDAPKEEEKEDKYDIATAKLRETLDKMRKAPKKIVEVILGMRTRVDESFQKGSPMPDEKSIPLVKSVIVANLLHLAGYGNSNAVTEVFNQIDGKLVKTISLLGGSDMYLDNIDVLVAPAHATKDENGYYIAENKEMTNLWLRGFAKITPQLVLEDEDEEY
jgi:hypothetical protein